MTPRRVNEVRAIGTWVARSIALVLMLAGTYLVVKRLLFAALAVGDVTAAWTVYSETGEGQSLSRGVAMWATGLLLAIASGRWVRWAIITPDESCPRCGYDASEASRTQGVGGRCPECGLTSPGHELEKKEHG